jgi:hypothetical protein
VGHGGFEVAGEADDGRGGFVGFGVGEGLCVAAEEESDAVGGAGEVVHGVLLARCAVCVLNA